MSACVYGFLLMLEEERVVWLPCQVLAIRLPWRGRVLGVRLPWRRCEFLLLNLSLVDIIKGTWVHLILPSLVSRPQWRGLRSNVVLLAVAIRVWCRSWSFKHTWRANGVVTQPSCTITGESKAILQHRHRFFGFSPFRPILQKRFHSEYRVSNNTPVLLNIDSLVWKCSPNPIHVEAIRKECPVRCYSSSCSITKFFKNIHNVHALHVQSHL